MAHRRGWGEGLVGIHYAVRWRKSGTTGAYNALAPSPPHQTPKRAAFLRPSNRGRQKEGWRPGASLAEELADELGVARDGVEREGESQAEDGAHEEGGEHELLLQLDVHHGRRAQEVHHDANERHAAWNEKGGRLASTHRTRARPRNPLEGAAPSEGCAYSRRL